MNARCPFCQEVFAASITDFVSCPGCRLKDIPLPLVSAFSTEPELAVIHKDHLDELSAHVRGKLVVDIGCGPWFHHAWQLLACGARRVIGVDEKDAFDWQAPVHRHPQLEYRGQGFIYYEDHLPEEPWVAYVSWPVNWPSGIVSLVNGRTGREPDLIIYRGKCTDGTMCGDEEWWDHVRQLEVLAHVPRRAETLIVYGDKRIDRSPLSEELAAVSDTVLHFSEDVPESTWLPLRELCYV